MKVTKCTLELIGNTPMIHRDRLANKILPNVMVKLEYLNPSECLKDRIALEMIETAERRGILRPGNIVVESTNYSIC